MKRAEETIEEFARRMKAYGSSLSEKSVIEENLATGNIIWVNPFTLSKTGYTMNQLCHMTMYDIVHPKWHPELSERIAGKRGKIYVLPFKTADGMISWWFCEDMYEEYPHHWIQGKHMTTTAAEGREFEMVAMVSDTISRTGEILFLYEDLNRWVRAEVQRLDLSDNSIRLELSNINRRLGSAISAAQDAANFSIQTNQKLTTIESSFKSLNDGLDARFDSITSEILSLLSGDKAVEQRIKKFDAKIDEVFEAYEKRIVEFENDLKEATRLATLSIELQVNQAGKTISKKVAWPVSVISSCAIIIAQLLQHPEIIVKFLGFFRRLL